MKMAPPTLLTSRSVRRGYTLVEAMLASALLSVSVVAVSGAISASYAQEEFARHRRNALQGGTQLLDEIAALQMESAIPTEKSVVMYNAFEDQAMTGESGSIMSGDAVSPPMNTPDSMKSTRRVAIKRMTSLHGTESATGDFAIVNVTVDNGNQAITLKRLVTIAETNAMR